MNEIEARFAHARDLDDRGQTEDAKAAYFEILGAAPTHFGTLNNLGNLLERTGFRRAARLTYAEAIKWHPANPIAYVNLGNSLLDADDIDGARERYDAALRLDPHLPEAHQGLSYVFERIGDEAAAAAHRDPGFRSRAITEFPYRGDGRAVPVVLLVSAAGGNIFSRDLLDDRTFRVTRIFAEYFPRRTPLPEHAVVFNAIADADRCEEALDAAAVLLTGSTAAVVNAPSRVLSTQRTANSERLHGTPGIIAPRMALISRAELVEYEAEALTSRGFSFPLLLRTPGHHTGRHFEMAAEPGDVARVVASLPGDLLTAIEYLDASAPDGKIRKYRVMIVDGKILPLHLAISREWKVHYFSADMVENDAHRQEDEHFLNGMEEVLGPTALDALERIVSLLGLDYGGVDFGINARGELLLFEANAAMIVAAPDDDPRWAYRRPHVQRVFDAVRTMVIDRALRKAH